MREFQTIIIFSNRRVQLISKDAQGTLDLSRSGNLSALITNIQSLAPEGMAEQSSLHLINISYQSNCRYLGKSSNRKISARAKRSYSFSFFQVNEKILDALVSELLSILNPV